MITVYGKNATLAQVRAVPLRKPPDAGPRWMGIKHGDLVNTILLEAHQRGWRLSRSGFSLTKDKTGLVGAWDIELPRLKPPKGLGFALGFSTSNDRQRALRIYVGGRVTVCTNGLATGSIVLHRRHTIGLQLRDQISEALDDYMIEIRKVSGIVRGLKEQELTEETYEHLLLEAGRQNLMPWSRLQDVDQEYRKPRFREFKGRNGWSLLNAFTWVVKRNPPARQMEQIDGFRGIVSRASAV